MQFDPTRSIISPATHSTKRPLSQQSVARLKPDSPKVPRIETSDTSSSFSHSRQAKGSKDSHSALSMAPHPSMRQGPRGPRPHPTASGSSSRPAKKPGKLRTLDGPIYDEAHIRHTFCTSHIRPTQEEAPKSTLGNVSYIACDKMPTYKSVEGHVFDETKGKATIWRLVEITCCPPHTDNLYCI